MFTKIKTNKLLFSHIPVILRTARASYRQENEPTSIEADIKPSYFDLQICTERHTQLAAFLFVQVMENVGTINDSDISDSVKKKLSAQEIFFFYYYYHDRTANPIQIKVNCITPLFSKIWKSDSCLRHNWKFLSATCPGNK